MYEKADLKSWTNESTTKSHGVNSLGAHHINSEVGCFNSEDGDELFVARTNSRSSTGEVLFKKM